jgi:hypothetical protein
MYQRSSTSQMFSSYGRSKMLKRKVYQARTQKNLIAKIKKVLKMIKTDVILGGYARSAHQSQKGEHSRCGGPELNYESEEEFYGFENEMY